ncbi:unnamed protein product [Fraxinus pennsylvanica]|uniref:Carbohydrate kinase PfkB domain-containing protein n=1 Tax=Fraxinus pennsylvanica TaxID=56036 RepID=A0AAD1ZEC9_9LAMI|nr:unnamed protein product [Fraxinus pennsylvanica]
MASLPSIQFSSLPRWHPNGHFFPYINLVKFPDFRLKSEWVLTSVSKKKSLESLAQETLDGEAVVVGEKKRQTTKRASARSRKKGTLETPDKISVVNGSLTDEETETTSGSNTEVKKSKTRTRKKAASASASASSTLEEEATEKKVTRRRRTKKPADKVESQGSETEYSDNEGDTYLANLDDDNEQELEFDVDEGEDISFTYGWPPLVCCFGAVQHAFVPFGRRANRLLDHEMHERKKDAMWAPEKFVRAPGGCSSNVAVALASLGGKVAFMGKLGDDAFGHALIYYLNSNKVQTRSIHIDGKRKTAVSHMKIGKRGGLRMTCVRPCAEDCLSRSDINIDVLKEAKMLYINTFSLLDRNMRLTALQAIRISKKLGGVIFYDLNLPLPLWQSSEETKAFILQAWNLADIIEVTKQELEFLCGIEPSEKFDTEDNDRSKFTHYEPEVVARLWHENLKVLFVTNGTSKIHYYTREHDGAVNGMEDAPLTPFTSDMSASGDGIVAGIMRMLTVQPHRITDKGYLETTIKYAMSCGVIDQWLQARSLGFPPKEEMEDVISDPNGLKSITEKEYRTLVPASS